jgi:hypothetical protein
MLTLHHQPSGLSFKYQLTSLIRIKMKLSVVMVSCSVLISGCVNINTPDNLVSDTVKVTKDIYHSVKRSVSNDTLTLFSSSYEIPVNEIIGISNGKCMDSAIEKAKKSLNKYSVDVKETKSEVLIVEGKTIINCSVGV